MHFLCIIVMYNLKDFLQGSIISKLCGKLYILVRQIIQPLSEVFKKEITRIKAQLHCKCKTVKMYICVICTEIVYLENPALFLIRHHRLQPMLMIRSEKKNWYFVNKIVLTYCEKKLFQSSRKLLKFEAECQEFANIF